MLSTYSINNAIGRYIILAAAIAFVLWTLYSFTTTPPVLCIRRLDRKIVHEYNKAYTFENLNPNPDDSIAPGQARGDHVLILTPFKEAVQHLDRYFNNINRLTYPHHLISLGFLVSDSLDGTPDHLQSHAKWFTNTQQEPWQRFHSITILQKDFDYILSNNERHNYSVQIRRREIMSRSRNYLLTSTLREDARWVLWLDGDVIDYPDTLLEDLISVNKDIIVPNCMWHSYNEEGGYDLNNWQETNESYAFQLTLRPDDVLMEGYKGERMTYRRLLIDMANPDNRTDTFYAVPLDGVGGTCTLVNAEVHRQGVIFPPFVYRHGLETEGLAKMAKAMGFEIWGLPNYHVYHYV